MRRVDRWNTEQARGDAAIEAALGAMAMDDVRIQNAGHSARVCRAPEISPMPGRREIGIRLTPSAHEAAAVSSSRSARFAAGRRIAQDADVVAEARLTARQIAHMAEQARPPVSGIRGECAWSGGSEPAFANIDNVAGIDLGRHRHLVGVGAIGGLAGNQHVAVIGPGAIATGNGDGVLNGDAGLIGKASGGVDLAQDIEGPQRW